LPPVFKPVSSFHPSRASTLATNLSSCGRSLIEPHNQWTLKLPSINIPIMSNTALGSELEHLIANIDEP
jgi:hypothetical protein